MFRVLRGTGVGDPKRKRLSRISCLSTSTSFLSRATPGWAQGGQSGRGVLDGRDGWGGRKEGFFWRVGWLGWLGWSGRRGGLC